MTWLRLDTDFPRHALIGTLAEKLRIDKDRAAMALLRVWCHFAELEPHGLALDVSDSTLEDWAAWRGPKGRFALVFREYCVEPSGKLRGWWRQEKLLAHQEEKRKRRKKPAENRQKTGSGNLPTKCRESADNEDDDGDVNGSSSSSSDGEPVDAIRYAQICTAAANKGLHEALGTAFHELVSSNQSGIVADWITAAIPVGAASRAIYERARTYKATTTRKQPTGLQYFRQVVQEAWDREQGRGIATPAPRQRPEPPPAGPGYRKYKPPQVERTGLTPLSDTLARLGIVPDKGAA